MAVELALPGQRAFEIGLLAGRLVTVRARRGSCGVVRSKAGEQAAVLAPGMAEPIAAAHFGGDEHEGAGGAAAPRNARRRARSGVDQRRDHQPIPVGQHLVVEPGTHALAREPASSFARRTVSRDFVLRAARRTARGG